MTVNLLTRDQDPRFPRHSAGQWWNATGMPIIIGRSGNSPALGDEFVTFLV